VTPTHTEPTHTLSLIQRNHHYRDCLYKTYNTEHKYINFGLFGDVTEVNITRVPWSETPSLPIPDVTHQKKEPLSPHKALVPPTKPEHDTTLCSLLGFPTRIQHVGQFRADVDTGWVENNRSLTPVRGTIPNIYSPSPVMGSWRRVVHLPGVIVFPPPSHMF
jgi:hypothetical protein